MLTEQGRMGMSSVSLNMIAFYSVVLLQVIPDVAAAVFNFRVLPGQPGLLNAAFVLRKLLHQCSWLP